MSVKGRRAQRTLDAQSPALRFPQRQAVVSGRGMDPCPEPETRAVLTSCPVALDLFGFGEVAPGIVTRKGGNSNEVNGSVSKANRARKGAREVQLALVLDEKPTPALSPAREVYQFGADHNLGRTAAEFYSIYHEGFKRREHPLVVDWAYFRWEISTYREREQEGKDLINPGGWLALRIQQLGGMAAPW
mgnify:CR=1 FL=1